MRQYDHTGSGCIGGSALLQTEYKIADIPEMNYTSKDGDENNNPIPRGEMCIRGPSVFLGSYKDEARPKKFWMMKDG